MKRNKLLLLLFALLALVSGWLYFSRSSGTLKGDLKEFAVADTASIDKIFMADKDGRSVTLTRSDAGWMVNGKYFAREDAIQNLLYTIKAVEVRSPVGKNLYNNTMKLLAAKSTKVEVYKNGEQVITYYVGHPTMDNLGTFMYIEGSTVPYITHIPGFNGFLSTRYFASEAEWREKSVFRYDPRKLAKVRIRDFARPARSFELTQLPDSSFRIIELQTNQPVLSDLNKIRMFLMGFSSTFFERFDNDISRQLKDSIRLSGPFAEVTVIDNQGETRQLTCFRKPIVENTRLKTDPEGKPLEFDIDKFYGVLQGDTSWIICQYYHFDRIFKDPQNFRPGADVTPLQQRFE